MKSIVILFFPDTAILLLQRFQKKLPKSQSHAIAPSKTFNLAGLSTSSVIISNPVLRKYFNKKIEHLHIGNGNIFGTIASIAAYSEGQEWLDALLDYLNGNVDYVRNYLQ